MEAQTSTLSTIMRFGLIGGLTALIYALSFMVLAAQGLATFSANLIAYLAAIVFQFAGHRWHTFRSQAAILPAALRFAVTNGIGLFVSSVLAYALRDLLRLGSMSTGVIVSGTLAILNWQLMRLWVFRR